VALLTIVVEVSVLNANGLFLLMKMHEVLLNCGAFTVCDLRNMVKVHSMMNCDF
jgi:hypothetical protein